MDLHKNKNRCHQLLGAVISILGAPSRGHMKLKAEGGVLVWKSRLWDESDSFKTRHF